MKIITTIILCLVSLSCFANDSNGSVFRHTDPECYQNNVLWLELSDGFQAVFQGKDEIAWFRIHVVGLRTAGHPTPVKFGGCINLYEKEALQPKYLVLLDHSHNLIKRVELSYQYDSIVMRELVSLYDQMILGDVRRLAYFTWEF